MLDGNRAHLTRPVVVPPVDIKAITNFAVEMEPRLNAELLSAWLTAIVESNAQLGLVSKTTTGSVLRRLTVQSAALLAILEDTAPELKDSGFKQVDIGTGAGFPGLAWRLIRADIDLTLIERKQRKAQFLTQLVERLNLPVSVFNGDAREILSIHNLDGKFDVATTIAVGSPQDMGRSVERCLRSGGWYVTLRPLGEEPAAKIGKRLALERVVNHPQSIFCIYKKP